MAPEIYINSITFNDGTKIDVEQGDIVVIVGANNSGKSQSLVDIQNIVKSKVTGIVVSDVAINIPTDFDYNSYFAERFIVKEDGAYTYYHGVGFSLFAGSLDSIRHSHCLDSCSNVFIRRLSTAERLSVCNPPESVNVDAPPLHPIHLLARSPEFRRKVTKRFKEAFGCELVPDVMFGRTVPLRCVDEIPDMSQFSGEDEFSRQDKFYGYLRKFPVLHSQGDGMRSFAGVLLNLIMDYVRMFLIDEPESFLHPPQARIMGSLIGEVLNDNQQAFIATHSEEIIRGLISAAPKRVKVVRLSREASINRLAVLDSSAFTDIWSDPVLRYSNIMSGMFHTKTVVCESDSDCQFYSAVDAHLKQKSNKYPEALYVCCGGKSRFSIVARALRSLAIDYRIIGDIDVLNDEEYFKALIYSIGINWSDVCAEYQNVAANLRVPRDKIGRKEAESLINSILRDSSEVYLSKKEIADIKDAVRVETKWDLLKRGGVSVIPAGDPTNAWKSLNEKLKAHGLFLLPVGEIENFVKEVGGLHGPGWVTKVLSGYPDMDNEVYREVSAFVQELNV